VNPESIRHLQAAARNQVIAETMLQRPHPGVDPPPDDWIITMLFYSALHLIDAYTISVRNEKAHTHQFRNRLVKSDALLSQIADEYLLLGDFSRTARYTPMTRFSESLLHQASDQLEAVREVIGRELGNG
jgi:hypothetical protein